MLIPPPLSYIILATACLISVACPAFAATAADYRVAGLPGLAAVDSVNIVQHAGHIELDAASNANMFFWLIHKQKNENNDKFLPHYYKAHFFTNDINQSNACIISLKAQAGMPNLPAICFTLFFGIMIINRMDGLFLELGPYRVNPDQTLSINEAGWQEYANILYGRQPYPPPPRMKLALHLALPLMSWDVLHVFSSVIILSSLFVFRTCPLAQIVDQPLGTGFSFANTNSYDVNLTQLYLAGESYAGTYIPYIASKMMEHSRVNTVVKYNLKGLIIGNGWIADKEQYDAYYDFSVAKGLLTGDYMARAAERLDECHTQIQQEGPRIKHNICEQVLQIVVDQSYDIRMKNETYPACGMEWPYELPAVTAYLRRPDVTNAIHAQKQRIGWVECAGGVSAALQDDESKPSSELLPGILEEIPVLFGDQDLICNHVGTEYLISNMTWNGAKGLQGAQPIEWKIEDSLVGYYTTARNLTYVLIRDGSHMVPYDRPLETLDMINRFLGVSIGKVKGKLSWLGEKPTLGETPSTSTNTTSTIEKPTPSPSTTTSVADDTVPMENAEKEPWEEYYGWGTATLVFVTFFAGGLGCFAYRSRRRAQLGDGYSNGPGIGETLINGLLRRRRGGGRDRGLAVKLSNDQDETNELDELVIESPTLFSAEDASDDDDDRPRRSRFSIAEDDEEGFDDFQGVESERRR
ncbi:Alpha/Beta hydrolase protein [Jimgerdemannia flammicorona]|uniref:Carboxypeptidase n=1 Tax=Jimgerdemannia flammicorona TaxID=994334 RepID=A0A433QCQ4_9FUNG|nr:Alpha/Beta hydrolase protein [Jimgerdemannia flammicorona]